MLVEMPGGFSKSRQGRNMIFVRQKYFIPDGIRSPTIDQFILENIFYIETPRCLPAFAVPGGEN